MKEKRCLGNVFNAKGTILKKINVTFIVHYCLRKYKFRLLQVSLLFLYTLSLSLFQSVSLYLYMGGGNGSLV